MHATKNAAQAAALYGAAGGGTPLAELVQVHDGMIAKLAEARLAINEQRIEDRFQLTMRVTRVVDVLQMSLDHERGGELAGNLERLYLYFSKRLSEINLTNDPVICDELMARLAELRDGWKAVATSEHPPAPPPSPANELGASLSA